MIRPQPFPSTWAEAYAWVEGQRSERKRMLVGCGCCRLTWRFARDRRYRQAVEASERYVDGRLPLGRLRRRWELARRYDPVVHGFWMVQLAAGPGRPEHDRACRCRRCRTAGEESDHGAGGTSPLPADVRCGIEGGYVAVAADVFGHTFPSTTRASRCLTPTAAALAAGIYADRAFDRLPILADALEEYGCDDERVLGHCRGPGPHVRGCWVVDLVLGKG